jgi:hypothetical protein
MTSELTAASVKKLRAPFTPEAIKWRADQKIPARDGSVRCLPYIDSRLANERLTDVDPAWTADYRFLAGTPGDPVGLKANAPTACELTVLGVTRRGMGQLDSTRQDGKYAKSAVSDALKRAAVEFGVGAFLYALPTFKVDSNGYWMGKGKDAKGNPIDVVKGLTPDGVKQLRAQYKKIVEHAKFQERFGAPTDYGDVQDDERSAEPDLPPAPTLDVPARAHVRAKGTAP